jgi:outer membrane immunogenic protein
MKALVLGSAWLAAVLASVPAMAADIPVKAAPPPAAVSSWAGVYAGINGGYGWGRTRVSLIAGDPGSIALFGVGGGVPSTGRAGFDLDGGLFGGQIGFNVQSGSWLAGLEADFQWSGLKGSGDGILPSSVLALVAFPQPTFAATGKLEWFGTARFRLGYLPREDLLLYGTAGFAYGRRSGSGTITLSNSIIGVSPGYSFTCTAFIPCYAGQGSDWSPGFAAGGGAEYRLWGNWSAKAEYLYLSFIQHDVRLNATNVSVPGAAFVNERFERLDVHVARVGLNWRFGATDIASAR